MVFNTFYALAMMISKDMEDVYKLSHLSKISQNLKYLESNKVWAWSSFNIFYLKFFQKCNNTGIDEVIEKHLYKNC